MNADEVSVIGVDPSLTGFAYSVGTRRPWSSWVLEYQGRSESKPCGATAAARVSRYRALIEPCVESARQRRSHVVSAPLPLSGLLERVAATASRHEVEHAGVTADGRLDRERRLERLRLPLTEDDERLLVAGALRDDLSACLPAVRSWAAASAGQAAHRPWLLLCGPPGRGKTLAAAWWLLQGGGRYVGARELERLRMAAFGAESERYQALLDAANVVVDDLGREEQAGRFEQALLDLVDYRRRRGMRTVAIANLTRQQLQARYQDERLWSRLNACATFVADRGPDLRAAR